MAKSRSRSGSKKVCKCKTNDGTKCKNVANPASNYGYCTMHHKKDKMRCVSLARRSVSPRNPPKFPRASSKAGKSRKASSRRRKSAKYGFAGSSMAMLRAAGRHSHSKSPKQHAQTFKSLAEEYESLLREYADRNNVRQNENEISQLVADFRNDLSSNQQRDMIDEFKSLLREE